MRTVCLQKTISPYHCFAATLLAMTVLCTPSQQHCLSPFKRRSVYNIGSNYQKGPHMSSSEKINKQSLVSLEKFADNEWRFIYAPQLEPISQQLEKIVNDLNASNQEMALKILEQIKKQVPDYIASYVYISLILMNMGDFEQAVSVIEEGLGHIAQLFPEDFFEEQPLLEWQEASNRPFLRCLANLMFALMELREYEKATEVGEQLLMMNPNDHQGIRDPLLQCYFELNMLDPALELCDIYADDTLPAIAFGHGLLLIKKDKLAEAQAQLTIASEFFPEVAKELVSDKHAATKETELMSDPIQADEYWRTFGKYWQATPDALALLKKLVQ